MSIYIYVQVYIYIYTHTYIHTYIPTYIHTCLHAYMHTRMRNLYVQSCLTLTLLPLLLHVYRHVYMCTYIHTYICIHLRVCLHIPILAGPPDMAEPCPAWWVVGRTWDRCDHGKGGVINRIPLVMGSSLL